jgi:hypothetical protein
MVLLTYISTATKIRREILLTSSVTLLSDDIANRRTPHELQQYHKLLVDSTFSAILEPYDSEQRKDIIMQKVQQVMP